MMVNDEFLYLYQQLITHKTNSTKNKLIKQNKNPESEQIQICKSELNISMDFCASGERNETHVGSGDRNLRTSRMNLQSYNRISESTTLSPIHHSRLAHTLHIPVQVFRVLGCVGRI
jgi:hypothetical protein